MACTIDATVGGAASNSYVTVAEADAYHEAHVSGATWAAASADAKCRALVSATRQIDAYVEWTVESVVASDAQALAWPRVGMVDPRTQDVVSSGVLPTRLKEATCEQARALLAGDRSAELSQDVEGVRRLVAGAVELEFQEGGIRGRPVLVPSAWALLEPWGMQRSVTGLRSVPLLRV